MNGLDGSAITIILAILVMSLGLHYFQSRQSTAMEKRLRDDMSDLRDEINAFGIRLRDEIRASGTRLEKSVEAANPRIDDTNRRIMTLTPRSGFLLTILAS